MLEDALMRWRTCCPLQDLVQGQALGEGGQGGTHQVRLWALLFFFFCRTFLLAFRASSRIAAASYG